MAAYEPSEREYPHDDVAEAAVIGSALLDAETIPLATTLVSSRDFYNEPLRLIFAAIESLSERSVPVDQVSLGGELRDRGQFEAIGGDAFLAQLYDSVPTSVNAEAYAERVRKTALQRALIGAAGQIAQLGYDAGPDIEVALGTAQEILDSVRKGRAATGFVHIREAIDDFTHGPFEEGIMGGRSLAIPTGFTDLDHLLGGGMKRSDLIILAARPGIGKSALAINIAVQAAREKESAPGARVAIFSLEMPVVQLVGRMIAMETTISTQNLRLSTLTDAQIDLVWERAGLLAELGIYLDDTPGLGVAQLRARAKALHAQNPLDLVVVDYLQLVTGARVDNRVQEVSEISRALKGLARELDAPVLALSQLNRAIESRPDKRPVLSDLRESGAIEQDADIVMFIHRESMSTTPEEWVKKHPGEDYPERTAELRIAKHRNGQTGVVKLIFFANSTQFVNHGRDAS